MIIVIRFPPDLRWDLGRHVVRDKVRGGGDVVFGDGGEAGGVLHIIATLDKVLDGGIWWGIERLSDEWIYGYMGRWMDGWMDWERARLQVHTIHTSITNVHPARAATGRTRGARLRARPRDAMLRYLGIVVDGGGKGRVLCTCMYVYAYVKWRTTPPKSNLGKPICHETYTTGPCIYICIYALARS